MEPGTLKIVIEDQCRVRPQRFTVTGSAVHSHTLAVAGAAGVAGAWFTQTPHNVYRSLS